MRRPFPHLEAKTRGSKKGRSKKTWKQNESGSKNVVFFLLPSYFCFNVFFAPAFFLLSRFFVPTFFVCSKLKKIFFAREQTWYPKTEPRLGLC